MLGPLKHFLEQQTGPEYERYRYLLAVSGGVDSMVLLEAFARLLPPSRVVVAHFHHGLRGTEADADALLVEQAARERSLSFVLGRRDSTRPSDEASLREDRRSFLEEQRARHGCDFIVTAHHSDDQLETILMRLVRGTGLEGLRGIAPQRGVWLRPFLSFGKDELRRFADEHAIVFREDATNASHDYLRNRVRHSLTPAFAKLAAEFGGYERFLSRFTDLVEEVSESDRALEEQARSLLAHVGAPTAFWFRWDLDLFRRLSPFWRGRVLRLALASLGVATLSREDLERLIRAFDSRLPSSSFPGFRFKQSCGYAYLQTPAQEQAIGRTTIRQHGRTATISELGIELTLPSASDLEVRFFRPGDRWRGDKLKKQLLEWRIPQPERRLIPLVARKEEVLWIYPQQDSRFEVRESGFPFVSAVSDLDRFRSPSR